MGLESTARHALTQRFVRSRMSVDSPVKCKEPQKRTLDFARCLRRMTLVIALIGSERQISHDAVLRRKHRKTRFKTCNSQMANFDWTCFQNFVTAILLLLPVLELLPLGTIYILPELTPPAWTLELADHSISKTIDRRREKLNIRPVAPSDDSCVKRTLYVPSQCRADWVRAMLILWRHIWFTSSALSRLCSIGLICATVDDCNDVRWRETLRVWIELSERESLGRYTVYLCRCAPEMPP
ncbi:hypothetical protein Tco_0617513 [Tanacetum coccineum]